MTNYNYKDSWLLDARRLTFILLLFLFPIITSYFYPVVGMQEINGFKIPEPDPMPDLKQSYTIDFCSLLGYAELFRKDPLIGLWTKINRACPPQ